MSFLLFVACAGSVQKTGFFKKMVPDNNTIGVGIPEFTEFVSTEWKPEFSVKAKEEKSAYYPKVSEMKAFSLEADSIIIKNSNVVPIEVSYWIIPLEICQFMSFRIDAEGSGIEKVRTTNIPKICFILSNTNDDSTLKVKSANSNDLGVVKVFHPSGLADRNPKYQFGIDANKDLPMNEPMIVVVEPQNFSIYEIEVSISTKDNNSIPSPILSSVVSMSSTGVKDPPVFELNWQPKTPQTTIRNKIIMSTVVGASSLVAIACVVLVWKGMQQKQKQIMYNVDTESLVSDTSEPGRKTLEFAVVMDSEL